MKLTTSMIGCYNNISYHNVVVFNTFVACGMACFFRHSKLSDECGNSRGISGLFWLTECDDDIHSHLATLHPSRELLTEKSLTLARVRDVRLRRHSNKSYKNLCETSSQPWQILETQHHRYMRHRLLTHT